MARAALRIEVTTKDRKDLRKLLSGGGQQVRVVLRAVALLQLAKGVSAPRIAEMVPLTPQAIRKIGHRYREGGLERALYEKQRPGAEALLENSQKQRIIAMVCSDPPEGFARWTVRLVAEEAVKRRLVPRVGRETIRILLLSYDLKPWREKKCGAWPNSMTSYIAKMEDVLESWRVALADPSRNQCVVCLDESAGHAGACFMFALHHPPKPGREARQDNEYERRGTAANVFCAVEPKAGRHFTFATPDRSGPEFAQVEVHLALQYPAAKTIQFRWSTIWNIHRRKSLTDLLGDQFAQRSLELLHGALPTHGSWLNQAEIEIGLFSPTVPQADDESRIWAMLRRESRVWNGLHEPRPSQNQLGFRPRGRSAQVPLQKELFHAVVDLERTQRYGVRCYWAF